MSGDNGGMREADHETPEASEPTPAAAPTGDERPSDEREERPDESAEATGTARQDVPQAAQPKSAYELPSRKNTVLRNMVWALALTMAVVVVIGIAFFGVGSDHQRERLENSEVDVAASAERAEGIAPFPVAVPRPGEGWSERSARFTDGGSPRWVIQYSSPHEQLVTLTQESEVSSQLLSSALPGSVVEEELEIDGVSCELLRGGEQGAEKRGISCEGEGFGLLVHGGTDREELQDLAEAALADVQGDHAA
ncbi:hypothetical protein CFK41_05010 [Brachybacterium ginsengisoli]|uniref:DUF4245 domain-containing protein n=2 Tax=Brachybacterium ginsengisoli TaxID=1331682 RepID=A0A291GVJ6_9MICO|nr:hypothetical protein CFK41_05010 [Brachybacterium ginsengisoli]